jgi:hypothetical protein
MSTILPAVAETSALESSGAALMARAEAIQVIDQASLEEAAGFAQLVKAYLAEVEAFMGPVVAAAHAAHKTAVARRDGLKAHAVKAEALIKGRISGYVREQDRLRREAEERARREREEAERRERERVAAETARRIREEEEWRLSEAADAEARGDARAAEQIIAAPVVVDPVTARPVFTPPVYVPPAPKVAGVTVSEDWTFEVVDEGAVPRDYLVVDRVAIGKVVRALKGRTSIPGIRVWDRGRTSVRA